MSPSELNQIPATAQGASPLPFQALALTILAVLLVLTIGAAIFKKATKREAVFWSFVWLTGAVAILRYDLSMTIARKLGIGRGADLLLYCSVGVMMVGFMMVYIRLRRLRREITLLVRHLALKEASEGVSLEKKES